jgi:hypothetical protein
MDNKPIQLTNEKRKSPALALVLGFAPTAILLLNISLGSTGLLDKTSKSFGSTVLGLACIVSAGCCFVSSFLLFKRKTALAIFGGVVFLLLNAAMAFAFGCGAVLLGSNFH